MIDTLEEEFAFLLETVRLQYDSFMSMPVSRRKRLVEWKEELEAKRKVEADRKR